MVTVKSTGAPSKSGNWNRNRGSEGEQAALHYLKKKGYSITDTNYRCCFGEIDIIARDGKEYVFVEVKSRSSSRFGEPEAAVNRNKQGKLSRAALHYLENRNLHDRKARFDVLAVTMTPDGNEIRHIPDAFDLTFF